MMSRKSSARTAGPLSIGLPEPLNTRPAFKTTKTRLGMSSMMRTTEREQRGRRRVLTQHVFGHGRPQDVPCELAAGFLGVNA